MKYPPHIRKHIEALSTFARLNNIPGIVVPAQGEAQTVRPMRDTEQTAAKKGKGYWAHNSRKREYELVIDAVFTACVKLPPLDQFGYYVGLYSWQIYGKPEIKGEAKSLYGAMRAARRALRMLSSEQS